jgi:hypothetical protein
VRHEDGARFYTGIGRYFSVFTIPIPKKISVGTFRYHFFGGNPFFPKKGGNGPLFEEKGGTGPLFDTASPSFVEKRSSRQISNTDRKYRPPSKSNTGKIPIPKKLLVTPLYTTQSNSFWKYRKWVAGNNAHRGKGNSVVMPHYQALRPKTLRNRSPTVWVGKGSTIPQRTLNWQLMSEILSKIRKSHIIELL